MACAKARKPLPGRIARRAASVRACGMKIALVTDWFAPRVGGIEVHIRELAIRLRQRGHAAVVLTPWPGPTEVSGVPVQRIPAGVVPGLGVSLSPKLVRHFRDAFRRERYDVVHSHMSIGSLAAVAGVYAASRTGLPTVVTFHSVLGRWRRAYTLAAPVLGWRRWPCRVTAVSEAVARDLRYLMPDRSVTMLPPAIDEKDWQAVAPATEPGKLRLVTTARLHPRKRLDALLKVLAQVRERVGSETAVTLEVLGGGSHQTALMKLARRLELADGLHFLGAGTEADVRTLLARGDLFVNACDQESFGIAGLEALCAGIPVVARAEGGMSSFVDHEGNGLLVDSDGAMADALVALAQEPSRLARLRAGASLGIPQAYRWRGAVDRHVELYSEVMGLTALSSRSMVESV